MTCICLHAACHLHCSKPSRLHCIVFSHPCTHLRWVRGGNSMLHVTCIAVSSSKPSSLHCITCIACIADTLVRIALHVSITSIACSLHCLHGIACIALLACHLHCSEPQSAITCIACMLVTCLALQ